MKKTNKTPLAAAMGVAFMSTFAVTAVNAEANPFGMTELSQGYMQVAEAEMKCGANMKMDDAHAKMPEGACAGKKADDAKPADTTATDAKAPEASCGNMMKDGKMKVGMEASCGEMMKGKEGSCGMMQSDSMKGDATAKAPEASCGGMMEDGKMKAGMEAACGAMMKGKEGACGMMSSGDAMKSKEGSCGAAMKTPEDKATKLVNKPTGTKVVPYVPAAK
ncbi:MAG: hypothetical protein WCK96_06060 [Methylococcales bacterium]